MTNKTKTAIKVIVALFAILALPLVAADSYELYCLADGEVLDLGALCNPAMDPRVGPGNYCMHLQDNGKICSSSINICNTLGLSCSSSGGNGSMDTEPPILTISSPVEGEIYTERAVLLDLDLNEPADVYYLDNSDPRSWTKICSNCISNSKSRTFTEGLNDLTFKAIDDAGNEAFLDILFYIDSEDPKITSTEPKDGFSDGTFDIEFEEENPTTLVINYGNAETGMRTQAVDIQADCDSDADKYTCTKQINLADYDGEQIQYSVLLTDMGGNTDETTPLTLDVDYSDPVIASVDYVIDGKYITFLVGVTEPYFEELVYIDHSSSNPKEATLCTKLVGIYCEKKISFSNDGVHEIEIILRDSAGNEASVLLNDENLFTDSKDPKINDVLPDGDFASGTFDIEFEEENPVSVLLTYGNDISGMRTHDFNLADCTYDGKKYYSCSEDVSLTDYDGEEIEYSFVLTDRANQTDEDGNDKLMVDLTFPVINDLDYEVIGKYLYLTMNVTESNLDKITYMDMADSKPKENTVCTKLTNGICYKKLTFTRDGMHDVILTVKDSSGRVTANDIQFFTDSKKPNVKDVLPDGDFASGTFDIEFEEQNAVSLVLTYGNDETGMRTHDFNLADCTYDGKKYYSCSEDVSLSDYNGEEIEYSFVLTDRANQTDEDGNDKLMVDLTFPAINSINYTVSGKRATVIFAATEDNLDKITYLNHNDKNPKENTFCTKLKNGACTKTITLNTGSNNIDFMVYDEAGNAVVENRIINSL